MRYCAWAMRGYFRCAEVFTKTSFNLFWQEHFPEWKVFGGWMPGMITAIMEEQKKVMLQYRKDPQSINPYRLLVLDDVVTDAGRSPELINLATQGRHYGLCVMIATQHCPLLDPSVRGNCDAVFIFRLHEERALEVLARNYLPQLKLNNAMNTLQRYAYKDPKPGGPSQCLVIFNIKGGPLKDRIYFLQAIDPGKFVIGCKAYWERKSTLGPVEDQMNETDTDEEDTDDEDLDDFFSSTTNGAPPDHPVLHNNKK